MGEEKITFDPGNLFIKSLDDQDWQPLGDVLPEVTLAELPDDVPEVVKVLTLAELSATFELAEEQMKPFKELSEALTETIQPIIDAFAELYRRLVETMPTWCEALYEMDGGEWLSAYVWACKEHPKWVNILNRTKKSRTRKKYQDRILRAYQKEVNK